MTIPAETIHRRIEQVRRRYGVWARTYGDANGEGWFARVRARENRIVRDLLRLTGRESILDAGCGRGLLARELKRRGHEVWAVDCTPEMIEQVGDGVDRALLADLQTLDLGRTFDLIVCLGAMEYVVDPESVLRRFRDHLEDGGRVIMLVPRRGPGGWIYRHLVRRDGIDATLFSVRGLRAMCRRVGLEYVQHQTPFVHNFIAVFRAVPVARHAAVGNGAGARPRRARAAAGSVATT